MTTTPQSTDPLAPFIRLGPSIYLVEPRTSHSSLSTQYKPKTIILAFWYSAPPRAVAKYVVKYADLLPSARIIFILSGTRQFYLYPTLASHRLRLKPAIDILVRAQPAETTAHDDDNNGETDDSVHLHLFSNGGLFTTAHLLLAYKYATGKPLRTSAVVLDSTPGTPRPPVAIKALSYALPKTPVIRHLGLMILATSLWGSYVVRKSLSLFLAMFWRRRGPDKNDDVVVYGDDPLAFTRKAIIDQAVIAARSPAERLNMCYIYSDADELVPWKEVEQHAALAASKKVGGQSSKNAIDVHLEKFSGTPHVGHMREDPERYWGIVERYLM